jgi:hypothetical protein
MRWLSCAGLVVVAGCVGPKPPIIVEEPVPVKPKVYKSPSVASPPAAYGTSNPTGIGTPPFHDRVTMPGNQTSGNISGTPHPRK